LLGPTVGVVDGSDEDGSTVGSEETGVMEGPKCGPVVGAETEGLSEGRTVGSVLGRALGLTLGDAVGTTVGPAVLQVKDPSSQFVCPMILNVERSTWYHSVGKKLKRATKA
jgi:hypothetical protein